MPPPHPDSSGGRIRFMPRRQKIIGESVDQREQPLWALVSLLVMLPATGFKSRTLELRVRSLAPRPSWHRQLCLLGCSVINLLLNHDFEQCAAQRSRASCFYGLENAASAPWQQRRQDAAHAAPPKNRRRKRRPKGTTTLSFSLPTFSDQNGPSSFKKKPYLTLKEIDTIGKTMNFLKKP